MKKNKRLTDEQIEFIKDAHKSSEVCSTWKTKIEQAFPKLFGKPKHGKWYFNGNGETMFHYSHIAKHRYGFNVDGVWSEHIGTACDNTLTPATEEEVFEALKKEAIKRGFVGRYVYDSIISDTRHISNPILSFKLKDNKLLTNLNCVIFKDGKWAEVATTISKEEAEKELGKKIV